MSTLLSKHLQEPGLDELRNRSQSLSKNVEKAGGSYGAVSLGVFGILAIAVSLALPTMNRVAL